MTLWQCARCQCENPASVQHCENCGLKRWEKVPLQAETKPLPQRPAKGTAMYQMALDAAAFISAIPIGGGPRYHPEHHRQYLLAMAKKYPDVGWEEALLEWDRHCRLRGAP